MEKTMTKKEINAGEFVEGLFNFLLKAAADPPWIVKNRTGTWPIAEFPVIEQMIQQGASFRNEAAEKVEKSYSERREDIKAVLEKRRKCLEAYTTRKRSAAAVEKDRFVVAGRVTDKATGVGLPNVAVVAYDMDRKYDDRLGSTRTDVLGYFQIDYTFKDFKDSGEGMPETYIEVLGEDEKALYTSPKSFVQKTGKYKYLDIKLKGADIPGSLRAGTKIDPAMQARLKVLDRLKRRLASGV